MSDPLSIACTLWWVAPAVGVAGAALIAATREEPGGEHQRRPRAAAALGAIAALAFIAGGATAACGCAVKSSVAFAIGLTASVGAVWFVRGAGHGDSGDGGDDGGTPLLPPDPVGPSGDAIDWEVFEREFAAYAARTRDRVPA